MNGYDEIDAHLHAVLQQSILPKLISYFPKVQFIITTHSPLYLLGMEKQFGSDGFQILQMPTGTRIMASDFSEFEAAYNIFKETSRHREEIKTELDKEQKPIIFVEGDYDIKYIIKAAELFSKTELLQRFKLLDGGGYGNLDKIWKSLDNPMSSALSNKI